MNCILIFLLLEAVNYSLTLKHELQISPTMNEGVLAESVVAACSKFFNQEDPIFAVPTVDWNFPNVGNFLVMKAFTSYLKSGDKCVERDANVTIFADTSQRTHNGTGYHFKLGPFSSSEQFVLKTLHSSENWPIILFTNTYVFGVTLIMKVNILAFAYSPGDMYILKLFINTSVSIKYSYRIILVLILEEDLAIDSWFKDSSQLHDCLILKWVENSEVVTVYTVNSYEEPFGFCGKYKKLIYLDTWLKQGNQQSFLHNNSFRLNKIPKSLNCCRIVCSNYLAPYSIAQNNSGIIHFDGIIVRLLEPINQVMTNTRNCDKVGIINLQVGYLEPGYQVQLFGTKEYTYLVPMAKWQLRWSWFTSVFKLNVWFILICSLCVVATIIKAIADRGQVGEALNYTNISSCMMNMWAVILGVGVDTTPQSYRVRILFLSWIAFSFFVSMIFQSYFTSYFMLQIQDHQIQTKEELEREGYTVAFDRIFSYLAHIKKDSFYAEEMSNAFLYAINKPKTALYSTKPMFTYFATSLCKPEELPFYYEFQGLGEPMEVRMTLIYNPLIQNPFDALLTRLVTTGIPQKVWNDFFNPKQLDIVKSSQQAPELFYEPFHFAYLQSCFLVVAFGLSLSFVVFILELIIHRTNVLTLKEKLFHIYGIIISFLCTIHHFMLKCFKIKMKFSRK